MHSGCIKPGEKIRRVELRTRENTLHPQGTSLGKVGTEWWETDFPDLHDN